MIPISNLHVVKFSDDPEDWIVWRTFREGAKVFKIRGFGRTRAEALDDYEREVEEA